MKICRSTYNLVYTAGLTIGTWLVVLPVRAQVYSGGGLEEGVEEATVIVGEGNLRERIIAIVQTVLSYMALAAVVVIVIAGIRLVLSQGEEEQKEKAKRTILYAIVGLIIILLAKGLVQITIEAANA